MTLTRPQLLRCLQASRPDAAALPELEIEDILIVAEEVLARLSEGVSPLRAIQGAALAVDIHRSLSTPSTQRVAS